MIQFLVLYLIFFFDSTNGINVTFVPQKTYLTTADLPQPFASVSVQKPANVISVPTNASLYVPEGFTVKLYMTDLISPRYLIYTPSDDILVSEPSINRISCLVDSNADGYPDQRWTFADQSNGLNAPYGMAFIDNYFYVANKNNLRRYSWTTGRRNITGTGDILMTYDSNGHSTRTVMISPNKDRLFVSIGSASNVDAESLPRASIQQANLDGTNQSTFAYGLRNAVGLAFHPLTNDLYVSCQERDELGDDLVPDFFTRVQQNDFFGWPYAYLSSNLTDPRRVYSNGTSERSDLVAITKTPDVLFQAHSAVLDIRFYTGNQFPSRYQNGIFAAFHGSWNRNNGTGYKIVFIPFNTTSNRPSGYYEDFVHGFLTNPTGPDTFGRPVGLLVLKDGSLLFTEDGNNRIYQVQYKSVTVDTGLNTTTSVLSTEFEEITSMITTVNHTISTTIYSSSTTTLSTTLDHDRSTTSISVFNSTNTNVTTPTPPTTTMSTNTNVTITTTTITTTVSTSTTGDAPTSTATTALIISFVLLEYILS